MTRKNGIPSRWLNYRNIGEQIVGTPFIAFKVPLGERYFRKLAVADRFTIDDVLDNNPRIGLIIDLTDTDRYYPSQSVEARGVSYYKLSVPGQRIPSINFVRRFIDIVGSYMEANVIKDPLIGVHCTHGVNRTGYMICSYMIRELKKYPSDAVRVFEAARGHSIDRGEYVEALKRIPKTEPPGALLIVKKSTDSLMGQNFPAPTHARRWSHTAEPEAGPSWKSSPFSFARLRDDGNRDKRKLEQQQLKGVAGGFHKKIKMNYNNNNSRRRPSSWGIEDGGARYHVSRASYRGCPANPESAHLERSPDNSREKKLETREDPAFEGRKWRMKKMHFTSSPQPKHQPLPHPSPRFPSSAERGFGHGVERERGPGAGPVMSRGGNGRDWSRARGGSQLGGRWGQRVGSQVQPFDQHVRGRFGRGHARRPWSSSQHPYMHAGDE